MTRPSYHLHVTFKVSHKIWMAFAAVFLIALGTFLIVESRANLVARTLRRIARADGPRSATAHGMENSATGMGTAVMKYLHGDASGREDFAVRNQEFLGFAARYKAMAVSAEEHALAARVYELQARHRRLGEEMMAKNDRLTAASSQQRQPDVHSIDAELQTDIAEFFAAGSVLDDVLRNEVQALARQKLREGEQASQKAVRNSEQWLTGMLLALLVVSSLAALTVYRGILRPFSRLVEWTEGSSENPEEAPKEVSSRTDEFGMLAASFNQMVRRHHAAERALHATEQRFWQSLVEHARDLIVVLDWEGTVRYVSPSVEWVLGRKPEDLLQRKLAELLHASDREDLQVATDDLKRNDQGVITVELRVRHQDGSLVDLDAIGTSVQMPGVPSALVLNARDVTHQKRMRSLIERSAMEWRATFDSIEFPIVITDFRGNVQRMNRAFNDLLGGPFVDNLETPIQNLNIQPWTRAYEALAHVQTTRRSFTTQVEEPDTQRIWELAVTPLIGSGETADRVITIAQDVTPLIRLQQSVSRSETMAAIGSLALGVAHEVRNPLFAISATLDVFEERYGKEEGYQRYGENLRKEVRRLNQFMQDLLAYGRPAPVELSRGDISSVVADAIAQATPLAQQSDITIENGQTADAAVNMDKSRLTAALVNVLENAIQHSPAGERVWIEVNEADHSSWVECIVRDSGPGFAPGDLGRVFEPFFSRRRGGTGLGLAIVQKTIQQHGGKVTVANGENGGALVTIRLPQMAA